MNQFQTAREFGYIESNNSTFFTVYVNASYPLTIQTSEIVTNAYWSGNSIIAKMQHGQNRRYYGLGSSDFEQIY